MMADSNLLPGAQGNFPQARSVSSCRVLLGLLLAVGSSLSLGCGSSAPPKSSDPVHARQAVETFLKTWKSGVPQTALQELQPPIIANDDGWATGEQLVSYKLEKQPTSDGRNVLVEVKLTTRRARGKKQQQEVLYVVTTEPAVTIFRN